MSRFTVVNVANENVTTVGEFDTYREVMDFYDNDLKVNDPDGVFKGNYQIDDAEDVDSVS